LTHDELQFSMI